MGGVVQQSESLPPGKLLASINEQQSALFRGVVELLVNRMTFPTRGCGGQLDGEDAAGGLSETVMNLGQQGGFAGAFGSDDVSPLVQCCKAVHELRPAARGEPEAQLLQSFRAEWIMLGGRWH